MADIDKFMLMLQSPRASRRYDACEELRLAASLSPAVIDALEKATNDPDPLVRDAATRALAAHKPSSEPAGRTASATAHESLSKGSKSRGLGLMLAGLALSTLCIVATRNAAQQLQFTSGIVPLFYGTVAFGIILALWGLFEWLSARQ
jgi:hypothetical protein